MSCFGVNMDLSKKPVEFNQMQKYPKKTSATFEKQDGTLGVWITYPNTH